MSRSKNNITELSEIIAAALVEKLGHSEKISAVLGSRQPAAIPNTRKIRITKDERRRNIKIMFTSLHEKSLTHA